ncbi:MAG: diaminopimelate decarboxylase [Bacteroidia bacterium]|jgi:diaminopimelate decarboxylase
MEIQGLNVEEIAKEFGTPLYLYDAGVIERQVKAFRSAFPNIDLDVKYACKSNTNLSILKKMLELGTGLDTVSINEIKMGLMVGFKPDKIVFTPNCVDFSEIVEAVELGVRINIENLPNLEKFAEKYGDSIPCFVRLNPQVHIQANSDKVDWWHKQSKFGISLDQLPEVHRLIAEKGLKVNGIHIHSSSVIMTPEVFLEGAKTVFDIAKQFKDLEFLDFGGGIKVEVGDGSPVIDLQELGAQFVPAFQSFCKEIGKPIQLWFEPGRFLIAEAGMLLVTANVVKRNGNTTFVGTDSGFNQLIRPMLYDAHHEILNLSRGLTDGIGKGLMHQTPTQKYTVVGNICEIDNFAVDRLIPEVKEGDVLALMTAGAYGFSMASTYNSRVRPLEVIVENGEARIIRYRDSFEDLIRSQEGLY